MASGIRFQDPDPQFPDDNGVRLAGGSLTFYITLTTTPATTYSQADLDPGSSNPNPVTLNSAGRASVEIFLDPAVTYRAILKDSDGNVIWDRDPVAGSDVTDAIEAHDVDPDSHFDATESSRGYVKELANDTEAQAMADTERVLTCANLAALLPLTTRPGLVKQTTDAEVEAGTVLDEFVSPSTLQAAQATAAEILAGTDTKHFMGIAAFLANFTGDASKSVWKFPGGHKIMIGTGDSSLGASQNFVFASTGTEAFASYCTAVFAMRNDAGAQAVLPVTAKTTTQFTIDRDGGDGTTPFTYVAFGL